MGPTLSVILSTIAVSLGISMAWMVNLHLSRKRLQYPAGAFGKGEVEAKTSAFVIRELARQQRGAYALAWISVMIGLFLTAALVLRVILSKDMDIIIAVLSGGLLCDIPIGASAFRLYQLASQRFDETLSKSYR